MKNLESIFCLLKNVQILSALIWAFTILACAYVEDKEHISTILITAAGFHVILMTQKLNPKSAKKY